MEGSPNLYVIAGGIYNLGFAIFHLFFWRLFHWREDLASLTHINRSVMQILNLCLTFVFLLFAYLSLFHSTELVAGGLGSTLLLGNALFWFLRMAQQMVFFGIRNRISAAFTVLFFLGGLVYLLPLM